MTEAEDKMFACGIALACAALTRDFDLPTVAADILAGTGRTKADFKHVDQFDRKWIYRLFRDESALREVKP